MTYEEREAMWTGPAAAAHTYWRVTWQPRSARVAVQTFVQLPGGDWFTDVPDYIGVDA
jgi:hypothetical protein